MVLGFRINSNKKRINVVRTKINSVSWGSKLHVRDQFSTCPKKEAGADFKTDRIRIRPAQTDEVNPSLRACLFASIL